MYPFPTLRDQLRNRWDVKIHQFVDGILGGCFKYFLFSSLSRGRFPF